MIDLPVANIIILCPPWRCSDEGEERGGAFSECSMPETDRLDGCLDEIELGLVERETTPKSLMKLGIQLYLTVLSLSNIVSILETFDTSHA